MSYDTFGGLWKFINLVSRPDVLLTLVVGSRLPMTVILCLAMCASVGGVYGVVRWHFVQKQKNRQLYSRWMAPIKFANYIIGTSFFYLFYVPAILHSAVGLSCTFPHPWCASIDIPDIVLSWINFIGYSVTRYFYMMFTSDLSWQSDNYYSMAKAKLWSY
jgi:hypothetical protein